MAWRVKDVNEERLRFVMRAVGEGTNFSALCREFEISRPTGYVWLARYRECGQLQELAEESRRPHHSPQQTARETEERVAALRRQRPDWGARKLEVLLNREGMKVPRVTIHRILVRQGLVRDEDRHRRAVKRFTREKPNQLWQMDFKGMPESRKGCLPWALLDDHSRFLVALLALSGTQAEPVRQSLERVFRENGLPEAMLMDHGTPWWNMQSAWGWTWLTVWLMKLGIRLIMSGYRHPQTQGKVERCNGSLEAALLRRGKAGDQSWQQWLDEFRQEYNWVRPHEALHMETPAEHWAPSPRRYPWPAAAWEYPAGALVRKVRENGGVSVNGRSYFVSRALIGENVQLEALEDRLVVLFCRTAVREFDLRSGESHSIDLGQARRLRKEGWIHG